MKRRRLLTVLFVLVVCFDERGLLAGEKRPSVSIIYEALAASSMTLWLAEDARLFQKYGLDANVIHARGSIPVQALVGGSVEFGAFGGSLAVAAVLGGSDLVLVAAKGNFTVISFWVRKDSPLKNLAELKGKTIGVTRPGGSTHAIARLALKNAGLTDRDVKYLHHGGLPEVFASLEKGFVDVGLASPPRQGFRELVDVSKLKIPFLQGAIEVQRNFLQNQRETVRRFLMAYLESIKLAKEEPELAISAIARRLRVSPDTVRTSYQPHANVLEEIPYVRRDSLQTILDFHPKETVRNVTYEKLVDNSLLQQLENSGFVKSLYTRN
jgi:ABC-type nitrate/sulfonate/bicarbonate transport system substrate-binding protein